MWIFAMLAEPRLKRVGVLETVVVTGSRMVPGSRPETGTPTTPSRFLAYHKVIRKLGMIGFSGKTEAPRHPRSLPLSQKKPPLRDIPEIHGPAQ
jgi:hypothetical protein